MPLGQCVTVLWDQLTVYWTHMHKTVLCVFMVTYSSFILITIRLRRLHTCEWLWKGCGKNACLDSLKWHHQGCIWKQTIKKQINNVAKLSSYMKTYLTYFCTRKYVFLRLMILRGSHGLFSVRLFRILWCTDFQTAVTWVFYQVWIILLWWWIICVQVVFSIHHV